MNNMLRGESFIFIEIPDHVDIDVLKQKFEDWLVLMGLVMPGLVRNIKDHLEIDCKERTITHDGDFDDISDVEKMSIIDSLSVLSR